LDEDLLRGQRLKFSVAIYIDSSFLLSLLTIDANYELSFNQWESDELKLSSKLLDFECFVNIHKIYRENSKRLPKHWLDKALDKYDDLKGEINLKAIDNEILHTIKSNLKLTNLKSLDSIHVSTALLWNDFTDTPITICSYDKNIRKICKELNLQTMIL